MAYHSDNPIIHNFKIEIDEGRRKIEDYIHANFTPKTSPDSEEVKTTKSMIHEYIQQKYFGQPNIPQIQFMMRQDAENFYKRIKFQFGIQ